MLTPIEIDIEFYKSQKHFLDRRDLSIQLRDPKTYYVLVDSDYRWCGISHFEGSIRALQGFDRGLVIGFNDLGIDNTPDLTVYRNLVWRLKLKEDKSTLEENLNIYSIEELRGYILTTQKIAALDIITCTVDFKRKKSLQSNVHQQAVYALKYMEARDILRNNVVEDKTLEYPLVTGYANNKGISLQSAAQMIKLKHEIDSGFLAETENIRQKYTDIVRNETELKNIKGIVSRFHIEMDKYGGI